MEKEETKRRWREGSEEEVEGRDTKRRGRREGWRVESGRREGGRNCRRVGRGRIE